VRVKVEYPDGCEILQQVLKEYGWWADILEIQTFWRWRSCLWSAGWLIVPVAAAEDIRDWWDKYLQIPAGVVCIYCGAEKTVTTCTECNEKW